MPKLNVNNRPVPVQSREATARDFGAVVGTTIRNQAGIVRRGANQLANGIVAANAARKAAVAADKKIQEVAAAKRAQRAATEYDLLLADRADEISLNPNLEDRAAEFEAARLELYQQFRPTSGSEEFDFRARTSTMRHENALRGKTRRDGISQAASDSDFIVNALSERAATAADPAERALSVIEAELEVADTVDRGIRTQEQGDAKIEAINEQIANGVLHRFKNEDPSGGLMFLESGEFVGTEAERQVWLGQMHKAFEAELAAGRKADEAAGKLDKERDKALEAQAVRGWIDRAGDPEEARITVAEVRDASVFLSPEKHEKWMKVAMGGGRITANPNRTTLLDLRERARSGDDVEVLADARKAFEDAEIGLSELTTIETMHETTNFNPGSEMLDTAVEAILQFSGSSPGMAVFAEQGVQEYEAWVLENPDAVRSEAMAEAKRIYQSLDVSGFINRTIPKQAEDNYVKDAGGNVLTAETRQQAKQRADSGLITETQAEDLFMEMTDLDEARRIKADISSRAGGGAQ